MLVALVIGLSRGIVSIAQTTRLLGGHDRFEVAGFEFLAPIAGGIFALLWGITSDRLPAKRLMLAAAFLAVASSGALFSGWAWMVPPALISLGIVSGAALVLPWLMLADYVGTRYIATIAVALGPVSALPTMAGLLLTGELLASGREWAAPALMIFYAIALFVVVSRVRSISPLSRIDAKQK